MSSLFTQNIRQYHESVPAQDEIPATGVHGSATFCLTYMRQTSVMIVEDERLIATDIASQLRRNGYVVDGIAASGEEALAHLTHSHPDLVLMDIKLQGLLDGIATATRIRTEYNIPVIFLTSHADSETIARAKHAEPFGYLVKPFRQVNLCSAIEMAAHKHQSDKVLMDRETWLSSVLKSTADATIVIDNHSLVRFLNPTAEKMLQCSSVQAAGAKWTTILPLFGPLGERIDERSFLTSGAHEKTSIPPGFTLRPHVGSEFAVEGEVSQYLIDGLCAAIVVTIRDVSARDAREARSLHEQKMFALGRLAGGVAHDFNNLLTIIVGHAALLVEDTKQPETQVRIAAVLDAANTAVGITTELLTLSGNRVLEAEAVNLNANIERLLTLERQYSETNIVVELNLEPSVGMVLMNPAQCDLLILNLLMNAREAMPDGGTVTISTSNCDKTGAAAEGRALKPFVRLLIKDTGGGMLPEVKKHIFDPFFTTKDNARGRGLGLSVVYGIVKDAAGEVTVESTGGCGANFEVLIPRWEGLPRTGSVEPRSGTADLLSAGTILLAEDDPAIRELLHFYLKSQTFHVIVAQNGQEALDSAMLYAGRIDILLSDVRMPIMDGFTLAQKIEELRPDTRTLLMSGYTGEYSQAKRGRFAFIQKPFTPPELLKGIQGLAPPRCAGRAFTVHEPPREMS